jgi:fibronectin type 3 domain-containing protein
MTDLPAYADTAVGDGMTYYYVVVAVDGAGNESDPSAEVAVADAGYTLTAGPTSATEPVATPTPTVGPMTATAPGG